MKIGDKVVCIDGEWEPGHERLNNYAGPHPVKDEIYVIQDIEQQGEYVMLLLEGFRMAYQKEAFRPLHYDFADEVIKNLIKQPIEA